MGRFMRGDSDAYVGAISCDRQRCRIEHTFPIKHGAEYHTLAHDFHFRWTPEQKAHYDEVLKQVWRETYVEPLPKDWILIQLGNDHTYQPVFCSARCARLWLAKLAAEENSDG